MLSIMICTNWVCAGVFVDDEWVSEKTIVQHEQEILGVELNYKIKVPCVVQWSLLWFSAPTELNNSLGREQKIKKYHEVVVDKRNYVCNFATVSRGGIHREWV